MHTLDYATADSINCAFVRLATSVGLRQGDRHRPRDGHHQGQPRARSSPSRSAHASRTPQTMATVMATIANGGVHHTPYVVAEGRRRPTARCSSTRPPTRATRRSTADVADCEAERPPGRGHRRHRRQRRRRRPGDLRQDRHHRQPRPTPGSSAPTPAGGCSSPPRSGSATAPATIGGAGFGGDSAAPCSRRSWSGRSRVRPAVAAARPGPGVRACRRRLVNQDGGRSSDVAPGRAPFTPQLPTVQQQPTTPAPATTTPPPPPRRPPTPAATTAPAAHRPMTDGARSAPRAPGARRRARPAAHRHQTLPERDALRDAEATPPRSTPALATTRAERDDVAREEQQLDDEAALARATRPKRSRAKMYSGEISSPRSCRRCRPTSSSCRRHQRDVENRELELMEAARAARRRRSPSSTQQRVGARRPSSTRIRRALADAEAAIDRRDAASSGQRATRSPPASTPRWSKSTSGAARWRRASAWRGSSAPPARAATCRSRPPRRSRSRRSGGSRSRTATTAARSWSPDARRGARLLRRWRARQPGPAAIGAVVLDPSTTPPARLAAVSERIGETTNNVAEYRALIAGLEAAAATPARAVQVRGDSKLVIEQLAGRWKVKQPHLKPLHAAARALLDALRRGRPRPRAAAS